MRIVYGCAYLGSPAEVARSRRRTAEAGDCHSIRDRGAVATAATAGEAAGRTRRNRPGADKGNHWAEEGQRGARNHSAG